jgi:hypothetical protein
LPSGLVFCAVLFPAEGASLSLQNDHVEETLMDVRIDEKGKYFTPRIAKDALYAMVRTLDERVVGYIYVRPDRRLKDEMNEDHSRFLPITDARVYRVSDDTMIYHAGFTLIAYDHIISVTPIEAVADGHDQSWAVMPEHEEAGHEL